MISINGQICTRNMVVKHSFENMKPQLCFLKNLLSLIILLLIIAPEMSCIRRPGQQCLIPSNGQCPHGLTAASGTCPGNSVCCFLGNKFI